MGRGHIPLTPEPRPLGPGRGSLPEGPSFHGAPVLDPRMHRAAELPESGAKWWTRALRSGPREGRRPALSAHLRSLTAVSFLFPQATAASAALLTGC